MEKSKVRQEHNRNLSSRNEPGWRKVGEERKEEREPGVSTESWAWRQTLGRRRAHFQVSREQKQKLDTHLVDRKRTNLDKYLLAFFSILGALIFEYVKRDIRQFSVDVFSL